MKKIEIDKDETVCANCKNYCPHFLFNTWQQTYMRCNDGYCHYPRTKRRKPGETGCVHFEFAQKVIRL